MYYVLATKSMTKFKYPDNKIQAIFFQLIFSDQRQITQENYVYEASSSNIFMKHARYIYNIDKCSYVYAHEKIFACVSTKNLNSLIRLVTLLFQRRMFCRKIAPPIVYIFFFFPRPINSRARAFGSSLADRKFTNREKCANRNKLLCRDRESTRIH